MDRAAFSCDLWDNPLEEGLLGPAGGSSPGACDPSGLAALVVGTIDEDKLQAQAFTRERKLAVARRSAGLLTGKYGIPVEDLVIDPLVFPCATGDVNYWGIDANVTCLEATIFRKEKRAVMTGRVRMFLKSEENMALKEEPIPELERTTPEAVKADPQGATKEQVEILRSGDNLRKFPVKVVADAIEYWYREGERREIITGSPSARQDLEEGWRFIWAHEGLMPSS